MKTVSEELKTLMESERPFTYSATIYLRNGSTISLTEDDIASNGSKITVSTGGSSFPVGYALSKCLTLAFFNFDDQYADTDFLGAVIMVSASVQLSETTETIDLDMYVVTEPEQYGTTITLTAYDYMTDADVPYTPGLPYPASLQAIVVDICEQCNFIPETGFRNRDFVVDKAPDGLSCRQMLGLIAMMAGGNAVIQGDSLHFITYGEYQANRAHDFTDVISQTIGTTDAQITGISLSSVSDEEYRAGTSGYVIKLTNELTEGHEVDAVTRIYSVLQNLTFRPFELQTMSYPLAEFGDNCLVHLGERSIPSYVNDIVFEFKGATTIKCVAESPARIKAKSSQTSSTVREMRRIVREERTARETAEADLSARITAIKGLYSTVEDTGEGEIYYLHDKPELENSTTVWKMTSEAFAVSTDGGNTWNAGLTVDGVLLAKILSANGVDADWINTGRIEVKDGSGNRVFIADMDTGTVSISGDKVFIGDTTVTEAISDLSGALTITLSNEMQGIPVDSEGYYDTFPSAQTTITCFFGGTDVTNNCTITFSEYNVTGTVSGHVYTASSLSDDSGFVTFSARYDTGDQILTASKRFNLFKVYAGQPGEAGSSRIYFLDTDATVLKKTEGGTFVPPVVHFNAFYRDGTEEDRHAYTGVFKVEITTDGETWQTVEEPTQNKTSTSYTPTGDVQAIRAYLYSTAEFNDRIYALSLGGNNTALIDDDGSLIEVTSEGVIISGGNLLDMQSVGIVTDVSALTQDQIFDILTNGSQSQGVYLRNGTLYINAEYIATGILRSTDGSTYWNLNTGELRLTPSAKIGTSSTTLTNVQTNAKAGADGFSALMTASQKVTGTSGSTDQEKLNSVFTKINAGLSDVSSIVGAYNASAYESWAQVFTDAGKGSSAQSEVQKMITARDAKNYADWNALYTAVKQSRDAFTVLAAAKGNAGYGNTYNTRWDEMFSAFKLAADSVSIMVEARSKAPVSGSTDKEKWESVFSQIKTNAQNITLRVVKSQLANEVKNAVTGSTAADKLLQQSIISLTEDNISISAKQLTWTALNTSMDAQGNLTATNAKISGQITANSGTIGGFTVESFCFHTAGMEPTANGENNVALMSKTNGFQRTIGGVERSNLKFAIGSGFGVSKTGILYASGAIIKGNLEATGGKIGGLTVENSLLRYGTTSSTDDGAVTLSSADFTRTIDTTKLTTLRLAIGGGFGVTKAGKLYASGAVIEGSIKATGGTVGGFTVSGNSIRHGGLTDNASGSIGLAISDFERTINGTKRSLRFAIGGKFGVASDGTVYANGAVLSGSITATGGTIGGFTISGTTIQKDTLSSTDDGAVALTSADFSRSINGATRSGLRFAIGSKFGVTKAGKIWADDADISGKITSTEGSIGGISIGNKSIYTETLSSTSAGAIALSSQNFERTVSGAKRSDLRFAIGSKFGVCDDGTLYASNVTVKGVVDATSGAIGGFKMESDSIHTDGKAITSTDSGSVALASGTKTFSRTINGTSRSALKFAIGGNFGVSQTGTLYAVGANLSGSIENVLEERRSYLSSGILNFSIRDKTDDGYTSWRSGGAIMANPVWEDYKDGDVEISEEMPGGYDWRLKDYVQINSLSGVVLSTSNQERFTLNPLKCAIYSSAFQASNATLTSLKVAGTKSRTVKTPDYGQRLMYAYETATPYFGDIGEAEIAEDGQVYVQIDPTLAETVTLSQYQVFLQCYGEGNAYIAERKPSYFVVKGTPGLSFGWEIKAKQADFDQLRLDMDIQQVEVYTPEYGQLAAAHIQEITKERTSA